MQQRAVDELFLRRHKLDCKRITRWLAALLTVGLGRYVGTTTGRFVPVRLAAQMTMHANEGFLQQIFGNGVIFNSATDEGPKSMTVLIPDLLHRVVHA